MRSGCTPIRFTTSRRVAAQTAITRSAMAMRSDTLGRAQFPTVQGDSYGKRDDFLANFGRWRFRADVAQHLGDQLRYCAHFRLAEAARGDGGRSEAHAAGIHGRIG